MTIPPALRVERLEDRTVPAGDVTAFLSPSKTALVILGDAAGNDIQLRGGPGGVVEVHGVNTTVNGGNKAVTFTGVRSLLVDLADGDDRVKGKDLTLLGATLYMGAGDDTVDLNRTTGLDALSLDINADYSPRSSASANGNDTVSIRGTTVTGGSAVFYFSTDTVYEGAGGKDVFTLADTRLDVQYLEVYKPDEYSEFGAGDRVTVERLDASVTIEGSVYTSFSLGGSNHDDTFRLTDVQLTYRSDIDLTAEVSVGSYDGDDTLEATNVRVESTTDSVVNGFNQSSLQLIADTVRVRNIDFVGGGIFPDGDGGEYFTGGWVTLLGDDVDIRNATVHTNGFGGLDVVSQEIYLDGIPRDGECRLTNVAVMSATGDEGNLFLFVGDGNDRVTVRNSSFENATISLGDGDDTLTLTNVAGDMPFLEFGYGGIVAGGGNDSVSLVNCDLGDCDLDLGSGDDKLIATTCHFDTLTADLGDGNDSALLLLNRATTAVAVDGGDGWDKLIAWGNMAPDFTADGFEVEL